jgi:hypothetical protein
VFILNWVLEAFIIDTLFALLFPFFILISLFFDHISKIKPKIPKHSRMNMEVTIDQFICIIRLNSLGKEIPSRDKKVGNYCLTYKKDKEKIHTSYD